MILVIMYVKIFKTDSIVLIGDIIMYLMILTISLDKIKGKILKLPIKFILYTVYSSYFVHPSSICLSFHYMYNTVICIKKTLEVTQTKYFFRTFLWRFSFTAICTFLVSFIFVLLELGLVGGGCHTLKKKCTFQGLINFLIYFVQVYCFSYKYLLSLKHFSCQVKTSF